ncbi:Cell division protein FtsW [Slackia heliotrinireducens]|uniref:Probable peptidoglycan glycosyltransferase FtsW n=2 Tax=Slackia TaxID=84108 RepID=C7N4U6_SLAHD|nr:bacterial cell division membrane protein [Slackia heliotrinireducens DSM 20476]VEG99760.1 Cell division protein FtsW [Slackia heliotrinireducens]
MAMSSETTGTASRVSEARDVRMQADARGVPASIMMPRLMLIVTTLCLVLFGLVMVFSASTVQQIASGSSILSSVGKQAVWVLAGALGAYGLARFVPYQVWEGRWSNVVWVGACLLLLAVAAFGTEIYGAKRWLYIGGMSMQPSEFAKIAFVLMAAKMMQKLDEGTLRGGHLVAFIIIVFMIPIAVLLKTQSDLGTTLIILLGVIAVLWLAEIPLALIVGGVALVGVLGVLAIALGGFRSARIQVWLNPWNDGSDGFGTGFQIIRSMYAFASGGLTGVGLGYSHEKYLYLPMADSDFIFSVVGEELGLLGCVALIVLFLLFLFAGLAIAHKAPDMFGRTLAGGMTVMLVGQAFLNMSCACGLLPTTGKPLPFVSSGGSSMLASMIMVGYILSVSFGSNTLTTYEKRRNDLRVVSAKPARESQPTRRRVQKDPADIGGVSWDSFSRRRTNAGSDLPLASGRSTNGRSSESSTSSGSRRRRS